MTSEQAVEVWELLRNQWPEGSVMRVFARSRAGGTIGDTILDPQMLARWTDHCAGAGYNAYVQMNPTKRKGTGRTSTRDVSHWSWFLVDLDPISETPQLDLAREFVEAFMIGHFGIKYPKYHLIDSGRGWQMWFPIPIMELNWQGTTLDTKITVHTRPLSRYFELDDFTDDDTVTLPLREAASRAMSYWLNHLKNVMECAIPDCGVTIDTSVSDLPRVMRLPYTLNFKTGRKTSILRKTAGWNVGLEHKLISYTPHNVWRASEIEPYEMIEGATWHHYLTHPGMKVNARIYLTEGAYEGGRHKAATAALFSLKELGCNATEAEAALLWGARLCSPPLEAREITPMIDRHYQRRKA